MARRFKVSWFLAVMGLTLCTGTGWTQKTTGTIVGEVRDQAGEPLPGATVTVHGERGVERTVATGAGGAFVVPSVMPGEYAVEATLVGMAPQRVDRVRVRIGGSATVNFVLGLEEFAEEVTVTSSAPVVDLTSSQVGSSYGAEFVEDLPTRRQFWDVASKAPGMSQATEFSHDISAFGSGTRANSWNVDGLNITHPEAGRAWWYVNPETVEEIQVLGVGAPAEVGRMTGAAINVVTKSGGNQFEGSANAFYQLDELTDSNVELADEEHPTYERDRFHNITGTLGGPIRRDRAWFFAAVETNRDSEAVPGVDPDFPGEANWDRYDLKLDFSPGQSTRLSAKGHYEDYAYPESGSRFVAPSARGEESGDNPAWGATLTHVFTGNTFIEVGYAGWWGDDSWHSLTGSTEPVFVDLAPPGGGPNVFTGGLAFPYEWEMGVQQGDVKLSHYADDFLAGDHDFRFGVEYSAGESKTLIKPSSGGAYYYHDVYYGTDYYYKYTFTPFFYGAEQESWGAFADDAWKVNDRLTLNVGVRYDRTTGEIPGYERLDENANGTGEFLPAVDDVVDWRTVSPRLGFAYVLTSDLKTVLRGSYGTYYGGSVSGDWEYPPPGIPPIQVFYGDSYENSGDNFLSETLFPFDLNVDPDLDPPRADQFALGVERQVGDAMAIGALAVYKDTQDLIGWEVLGDGIYEEVSWVDEVTGKEYILFDICDEGCRAPTIRKGNRPGAGSQAPDEDYHQDYRGLILTFERRHLGAWSLQGSYTWSRSEGLIPRPQSQSQGQPLYGSLDGTDPNEWLNGEQLLQNDREHMFRLQANVDLPWNLKATGTLNWQSGRAFTRLVRTPRLGQGRSFVISVPASDDARMPSALLLDLGIGKRWNLGRDVVLKTDVQVLNVLNEDAPTFWESITVDAGEQFVEDDWPWPRRVQLRLGLEF